MWTAVVAMGTVLTAGCTVLAAKNALVRMATLLVPRGLRTTASEATSVSEWESAPDGAQQLAKAADRALAVVAAQQGGGTEYGRELNQDPCAECRRALLSLRMSRQAHKRRSRTIRPLRHREATLAAPATVVGCAAWSAEGRLPPEKSHADIITVVERSLEGKRWRAIYDASIANFTTAQIQMAAERITTR